MEINNGILGRMAQVKHSKWNWECDSGLGSVSKKEVIVALASL